jgi:hypothetical protein
MRPVRIHSYAGAFQMDDYSNENSVSFQIQAQEVLKIAENISSS